VTAVTGAIQNDAYLQYSIRSVIGASVTDFSRHTGKVGVRLARYAAQMNRDLPHIRFSLVWMAIVTTASAHVMLVCEASQLAGLQKACR